MLNPLKAVKNLWKQGIFYVLPMGCAAVKAAAEFDQAMNELKIWGESRPEMNAEGE